MGWTPPSTNWILLWESFYFYWIHRMIHLPFLYKHVHSLHHRNINVGPWSGMSMHPVEHANYLGSVFIHLIVGAHPVHILYHLQYFTLTAVTTHTGFQGLLMKDRNRLNLGTFHHQMHHRYFECNYGGLEMPWDKWFGSFHDGTVEAHQIMQERRKKNHGQLRFEGLTVRDLRRLKATRQIAFDQGSHDAGAIVTKRREVSLATPLGSIADYYK